MEKGRKLYLVGNAHIDHIWLWRWQEGYAEIKATFRSALDRMNEFPEFIFSCAGASYYQWVEENCPEMFEEIRRRVREGRWVIVGGWWVQPDCNLASGESYARHGLYSQRYFKEKFGVTARTGYNLDSFGHSGMLPQILRKSGMENYVFMRPNKRENARIPDLFEWESEDGSRVMTFRLPHSYAFWDSELDPEAEGSIEKQKIITTMKLAEEKDMDFMVFYGVGNHGGGPTIRSIRDLMHYQDIYGKDRILFSSPDAYFCAARENGLALPVYHDDFQHHSTGCYSAHSEVKKLNRRVENRLLTAEKFHAVSGILCGNPDRQRELSEAWKNVMSNQFHDAYCGTSIESAYDDIRELYGESLSRGAKVLNDALQKISWSIDTSVAGVTSLDKKDDIRIWEQDNKGVPVVVFNPNSWSVRIPVQVNKTVRKVTDRDGKILEIQHVRGAHTQEDYDKWETLFYGDIPAMGYTVFWIFRALGMPTYKPCIPPDRSPCRIENDWAILEIERHTGHISRWFDKRNGVDILSGKGAVPIAVDEYPCSPWGGFSEYRKQVGVFSDAEVEWLEDGPVRSRIRVTSRYNRSEIRQEFMLYKESPDLEVRVRLDWREKYKMLKLSFPVGVSSPEAVYEIPYGFIRRPVNGQEEPGQQWLDVTGTLAESGGRYGLTLLNDCKYGFDVKDNDMRMTVARSPAYSTGGNVDDRYLEHLDQGIQTFTYVLSPHTGEWSGSRSVRKACGLNAPVEQVVETYHRGPLPSSFEGIRISSEQVTAVVFKRAEDGDGFVLRCHETDGCPADDVEIELPALRRRFRADFGKCEIKTFRIPEDPEKPVTDTDILEY